MVVLELSVLDRDVCIREREVSVLEKCLLEKGVCIREMSVLE